MKQLLSKLLAMTLLGAPVVVATVATTGCSSVNPSTIQVIATTSKLASKNVTYYVLKNNPDLRPKFEIARNEINIIATATNLNFGTFVAIVYQLPIKEMHNPVAEMIAMDAQLILNDLNLTYPLDKVENLRPIVVGVRDGMDMGFIFLDQGN